MTLCRNCHTVTIDPETGDLCEACADIIWYRPSLEKTQRKNKEARQLRNRALDIAGIGLYRLSTSDRESLIRFAKCRSFERLEDMPRREQIDVIARWLEARGADLFGTV